MSEPKPVTCINASNGEDDYVAPEYGAVCRHDYCLWVHSIGQQYRATRASVYTKEELDEMHSDRELMRDEFHVR